MPSERAAASCRFEKKAKTAKKKHRKKTRRKALPKATKFSLVKTGFYLYVYVVE